MGKMIQSIPIFTIIPFPYSLHFAPVSREAKRRSLESWSPQSEYSSQLKPKLFVFVGKKWGISWVCCVQGKWLVVSSSCCPLHGMIPWPKWRGPPSPTSHEVLAIAKCHRKCNVHCSYHLQNTYAQMVDSDIWVCYEVTWISKQISRKTGAVLVWHEDLSCLCYAWNTIKHYSIFFGAYLYNIGQENETFAENSSLVFEITSTRSLMGQVTCECQHLGLIGRAAAQLRVLFCAQWTGTPLRSGIAGWGDSSSTYVCSTSTMLSAFAWRWSACSPRQCGADHGGPLKPFSLQKPFVLEVLRCLLKFFSRPLETFYLP